MGSAERATAPVHAERLAAGADGDRDGPIGPRGGRRAVADHDRSGAPHPDRHRGPHGRPSTGRALQHPDANPPPGDALTHPDAASHIHHHTHAHGQGDGEPHPNGHQDRNAHADAHPDTDADRHRDADAHAHCHPHRDPDADAHAHRDGDPDGHVRPHVNALADAHADPDAHVDRGRAVGPHRGPLVRAPIPLYALALAVAAPIPVVGAAAFGLAAAVLAIGFASGQASTGRGWSAAGPGAAQLGGAVGALEALARVGTTDPYRDRVGLGVAALVLAFVAGAAIVAIRRPATGAALTVLAGVVGAGAMAAFYLETYYFAALPLWLVGAALALGGGTPTPKAGGGG